MKLDVNELPHLVTRVCLEVHRQMGSGLPEAVYRDCFARELRLQEIEFVRDVPLPIVYRGEEIRSSEITLDFVIEEQMLVLVSTEFDEDGGVLSLADQQREMAAYLRLSGLKAGLWVNFDVEDLRTGMHRMMMSETASGFAAAALSRN